MDSELIGKCRAPANLPVSGNSPCNARKITGFYVKRGSCRSFWQRFQKYMSKLLDRDVIVNNSRFEQRLAAHVCCALAMAMLVLLGSWATVMADQDVPGRKLASGDRISVTVFGQTELSGEFTVDNGGNIAVPLVGSIEVKNLTLVECQRLIVEKLADGILNSPSVSVRLAEPRPIYVLGDVKNPGSYPYRYGTSVKIAVAQAGGYGIAEQLPGTALSEFLIADERVKVLGATWRRLLVRQARLEAQLNGAASFTPPALPVTGQDGDAATLVAQETQVFQAEREALRKRIELNESQRPQLLAESSAIDGQIEAEKQQIELVRNEIDQYVKLSEKGLGKSSSMLELKLALSSRQSNVWRLEADRPRLQKSVMEFDRALQESEDTRKKQILTDLQDVRQRLREVEVTLPAAQEVREVKFQQTGGAAGVKVAREVSVTRTHNSETTTFPAAENDFIEPGDIVEIRRLPADSGPLPTTSGTKDAGKPTSPL